MKLKKLATVLLSGCLAFAALGSITANAYYESVYWNGQWEGDFSYGYNVSYKNGIKQKSWYSGASGSVLVWSCYIYTYSGNTYYGSGNYAYKSTRALSAGTVNYGSTTFYQISRNGVKNYLCTRSA